MNDKDKEAFEEWYSKEASEVLWEEFNGDEIVIKAWQAACEYKDKECSNLMDAMTRTSQNNAKLQAENAKLRECVDNWGLFVRFWSKVDVLKKNQCWEWRSSVSPNGYGKLSVNNKPKSAHVLSYTFNNGSVPSGMVIDHICRNRKCVNPAHLRAVSQRINNIENSESLSAIYYARTHCKNGHEFNKDNTTIRKTKNSQHRVCKKCKKDTGKRARQCLKELEDK